MNCDCKIGADKPDDTFISYSLEQVQRAIVKEQMEFLEEVRVTFRNLKPGKTVTLKSKPIRVTISREHETEEPSGATETSR